LERDLHQGLVLNRSRGVWGERLRSTQPFLLMLGREHSRPAVSFLFRRGGGGLVEGFEFGGDVEMDFVAVVRGPDGLCYFRGVGEAPHAFGGHAVAAVGWDHSGVD